MNRINHNYKIEKKIEIKENQIEREPEIQI